MSRERRVNIYNFKMRVKSRSNPADWHTEYGNVAAKNWFDATRCVAGHVLDQEAILKQKNPDITTELEEITCTLRDVLLFGYEPCLKEQLHV